MTQTPNDPMPAVPRSAPRAGPNRQAALLVAVVALLAIGAITGGSALLESADRERARAHQEHLDAQLDRSMERVRATTAADQSAAEPSAR